MFLLKLFLSKWYYPFSLKYYDNEFKVNQPEMNKRIIAANVLLALLGFACSSGNSQEQEVVEEKQIMVKDLSTVEYDHVFEEERPFAESHASTNINLDKGYLLAWFAGSHEKNDDVGIWMAKGTPDNWTEPELAVKIRNEP